MTPQERENKRGFLETVGKKARRKLEREQPRSIIFGLSMFGVVGWSVAIPTLIGIALGLWLDTWMADNYSWTLMMMFAGLVAGCLIAWHWVNTEGGRHG